MTLDPASPRALSAEQQAALDRAIDRHRLGPAADVIRAHAAPCLALLAGDVDDYSRLGNTRVGGDPDLPVDAAWPIDRDGDAPLYANFIAQMNFSELPRLPGDDVLPSSGILYVFVRSMESAADVVALDGLYYDGDLSRLARRHTPDPEQLCVEFLTGLTPRRIDVRPATSIAHFSKAFRAQVAALVPEIDGEDADQRRLRLDEAMQQDGQIGQLLGHANAGDERQNLYRRVAFGRLNRRGMIYRDYWDSMAEYEACIDEWKHDERLLSMYRSMRTDVTWLMAHREDVAREASAWRLLFRLDSNSAMDLLINDADPLYVFIREQDLARRDFGNLAGEVTQG